MDKLKAFWNWLDGKKTVIGVVLVAAPGVIVKASAVAAASGVDPAKVAQYAGIAVAVVGVAHKIYKAVWPAPEAPVQ